MSLIFQALSWTSGDTGTSNDDESDNEGSRKEEEQEVRYRVGMFGKTRDGRSVHLQVLYQPYFYVEIKPGKSSRVIVSRLEERLGDGLVRSRSKVSQHIRLFGFTNGEKGAFLKLVFVSHKAFRHAAWMCKNDLKVQTYESNVDPLLRFMHDAGIKAAGWVEVDDGCYDELMEETTFCDLEYGCSHSDLHVPEEEQSGVAPFVLASFDIETYSHDGSFPQPEEEPNVVFQIATTFQRLGDDAPYMRHLANLGGCEDIEGVQIDRCDDEMDVLLSWAHVIRNEQTDVLVGYNIWGFDMVRHRLCNNTLEVSRMVSPDMHFTADDVRQGLLELLGDPDAVRKRQKNMAAVNEAVQEASRRLADARRNICTKEATSSGTETNGGMSSGN